jgi:hypothetical protein
MKTMITTLLVFSAILSIAFAQGADLASEYNTKCAACAHASNGTYYYCTLDDTCRTNFVDAKSCEQGFLGCLAYKTNDLGVKEIPPFTSLRSSFNSTVTATKAIKFAISNQDSKKKGWFKLMLKTPNTDPDEEN